MKWRKLGLVFCPDGRSEWARTHAMVPTPVVLNSEVVRVYVTCCDAGGVGRVGYVDVDARDPRRVLGWSEKPVLDIGRPGTFDENGVVACSVTGDSKGGLFLYYVGFELGTQIRYRLLSGLAASSDGGTTFSRYRETPVLERSPEDLYFRCGPYVMREDNRFRLWYVAGSEWTQINGKAMPVYALKYLESGDGIDWNGRGTLILDIVDPDEHGFGRPWVVKRGHKDYQLFYSIRKRSAAAYRLGYAESDDGVNWRRRDDRLGLDITPGSFDSNAIMYSAVITVQHRTYCFYNGDNFGERGFGLAELLTA